MPGTAVTVARDWFVSQRPRLYAPFVLYCLPGEGTGADAFRHWSAAVGAGVDVAAVALPAIVDIPALALAIAEHAADRRFAFYGHAVGGRIALDLARELRRTGQPLPVRLFVGGSRPPNGEWAGGQLAGGGPLPVPLSAFAGTDDPAASPYQMAGWAGLTVAGTSVRTEPGDHLFAHSRLEAMADAIRADLSGPAAVRADLSGAPVDMRAGPEPDELHVWYADLDALPELAEAVGELSGSEIGRAERFHRDLDRARYIARCALLRRLLTWYGTPIGTAELVAGRGGKPSVDDADDGGVAGPRRAPGFNVSHSRGLFLAGFGRAREIGVDLERMVAMPDEASFVAGTLHPAEIEAYHRCPAGERLTYVLSLWTAKEAVLKATGDGLGVEPNLVNFAGHRFGEPWRAAVPDDLVRIAGWWVTHLPLPGAIGAVAAGGPRWRLRFVTVTP